MGRAYFGVDPTAFKSGRERKVIESIDTFLRDLSRGASPNQPATTPSGGGTSLGASYITVANEGALSAERKIATSSPLTGTDGGVNSTYTLGLNTTALAALLGAAPTFIYDTTFTAGTATTFIRTDAQHKFPSALMSTANSSLLTLTDTGTAQVLTSSLGTLQIMAPDQVIIGDLTTPPSGGNVAAVYMASGALKGLTVQANNMSLTAQHRMCWEALFASTTGILTGATISGYRASLSISPSSTSDTTNKFYGLNIDSLSINNANAGFSEVATANLVAPSRSLSNPTVTLAGTIILACPTISATAQAGIYIKQRSAQQAAANRDGILIDAMNSGTSRRAIRVSNTIENTTSDFYCATAAKGLLNIDTQGTPEYWRTYVNSTGATVGGAQYAVNNLGVLAVTRTGTPTGTLNIQIGDAGTAAPTT